MTYPDTKLPVVVQIAPGADLSADPSTWTRTDVTASVLIEDQIVITEGRGDWGDQVDAGTCALTFLNTSGDFSEHNPLGQWYGLLGLDTPLWVRINDVDLFGGFVPAWVPRWDMSGKKRIVPVVARGVLERLQPSSGTPTARSPLRRAITSAALTGLLAYWPCEDAADSSQAASGLHGGTPMTGVGAIQFAVLDPNQSVAGTRRYGTMPLPDLSAGGGMTGGAAPAGESSPIAWTVQWIARESNVDSATSGFVLLSWQVDGSLWEVVLTGPPNYDTVLRVDGVVRIQDNTSYIGLFEWRVIGRQVGANITAQLIIDGATQGDITPGGASPWTASWSGTLGWPTGFASNPAAIVSDPAEHLIGHVQVWDGDSAPTFDGSGPVAHHAYNFEAAHVRLARLCAEDGIAVTVPTIDLADGVAMSAQPDGTPVELYRECELADGGILAEQPFGLAYTPRVTLYNQAVALTLDAGDLGAPPEPDGTDQHYRNRMVVKRFGGSSATAATVDIATGIVRDESVDLRLYYDDVLQDHANWRLHLSTHEGLRWPRLVINLAAVPQHINSWLSCQVGSRIVVTNPPADVAGQDIDVLLEGRTTTLGYKDWIVEANLSPAAPWLVGVWETDRYATAWCELASTYVAGTDTSISITTTSGSPWRDGSSSPTFPMDWNIAGARVRVTAITGTGTSQTATCQAATVNGVNKSIPSGAAVSLWSPTRYPL